MGKILNTTYRDTVESITSFHSDLVKNPFYIWNNLKPTKCTYYNINKPSVQTNRGFALSFYCIDIIAD